MRNFLFLIYIYIGWTIWEFKWDRLPEVGSVMKTTLTRYGRVVSESINPNYSLEDKFYDCLISYGMLGVMFIFFGLWGILNSLLLFFNLIKIHENN